MIKSTRTSFLNVSHFFSRKVIDQKKLGPSEKCKVEAIYKFGHELSVYLKNASPIEKARASLRLFPHIASIGLETIRKLDSERRERKLVKREIKNLEKGFPEDKIKFAKQINSLNVFLELMNEEELKICASLPYRDKENLIVNRILQNPASELGALEIVTDILDQTSLDSSFKKCEKEDLLSSLAIIGLEKYPERLEIPFHKHIPVKLHQEIRDIAALMRFEKIKAEIQQGTLVDIDKDLPSYALSKTQNYEIIKLILESTEDLNIKPLLNSLNLDYFHPSDYEYMTENQFLSYKSFSGFKSADRLALAWICIKKDPTLTDKEISPFQLGKLQLGKLNYLKDNGAQESNAPYAKLWDLIRMK